MNDAIRSGNGSGILGASLALFVLFGVQLAFQAYNATRTRVAINADLLEELAAATLIEAEPAPPSAGWPQWRGPNRDGVVHAPDLLTDWPEDGPPLLWQKSIGLGYSSFAVKDGRLYSLFQEGQREVVACWRIEDGQEVWRHAYDCPHSPRDYPGPRSTPTLDGDRLYVVGSAGLLLCLNLADGSPCWQHDLRAELGASMPQWGFAFSTLVDGDLVFTAPGGRNGSSIAAFNKKTGDLVWNKLDDPAGYSSPMAVTVAGTRQIIFFTGDSLVGVKANTGELCWRFPWSTSFNVNAATPIIFQARKDGQTLDYVFISSGYDKGCALVKIAANGASGLEAKMVYRGNQICSHFASPVRRGAYVYGIDDARLTCMDLRTGRVQWTRAGVNKGSLLRVDDHLLVLTENGKLLLYDARPEAVEDARAEARPFRNRCWTMPVLADGRLFLRDERQMKCLDLKKHAESASEAGRGER